MDRTTPSGILSMVPVRILTLTLIVLALFAVSAIAQTDEPIDSTLPTGPQAPTGMAASDVPNDDGGSILLNWTVSPSDTEPGFMGYKVMRAEAVNGQPSEFSEVGDATVGAVFFEDGNADDDKSYFYKVVAVQDLVDDSGITTSLRSESSVVGPIASSAQWYDNRRTNVLVALLLLSFFIVWFIQRAKSGETLFIRKIAGMEAVDEAVGRATEMGRKIFFVPGINDMDNVQTIAAMTILGRVAEKAAQYDTWLEVPVCRSLVMVTAKEVVKEAYTKVGRADSYRDEQVHYLTDDQFGYAAAIDGMVVREKPATIFYMGAFFAESLILAETGNAAGAIQIAGTAMPAQLPFFVTACDYTLIGEELFAASAYLSKEPKLLGSLKGQDYGKGAILILIIIGVILETFGVWELSTIFSVID